jgi:hypothetical protein
VTTPTGAAAARESAAGEIFAADARAATAAAAARVVATKDALVKARAAVVVGPGPPAGGGGAHDREMKRAKQMSLEVHVLDQARQLRLDEEVLRLARLREEEGNTPYAALDLIGQSLLKRACLAGTARALRTAAAQSRVLVFVMGSTAPFLTEEFQDSRWVITDRVVNGSPVWAAEGGELFMFRAVDNMMAISIEYSCAEGRAMSHIVNTEVTAGVVAPTELPSDNWVSSAYATLATQYAERLPAASGEIDDWAHVPNMRITAVHGLSDDDPAMAEALAKLAAAAAASDTAGRVVCRFA